MGKSKGFSPPQLLTKQCSCLGGNPHCYKCDGWGYIDPLSAGRVSAGPAGDPLVPARGKRNSKKVQKAKLIRNLKPNQQMMAVLKLKSAAINQPIHMEQKAHCPHCGARVAQLNQHILKAHPGQFTLPHHKKEDLCFCTCCSAQVKASNLSRHMRRVHGKARNNKSATRPKWPTLHLPESSSLSDERPRGFDATREYAHNFRDHGQFGSYPSHDGFDDESTP